MSGKGPRTAYEIAMEKLRARDRERGVLDEDPLTEDQKARIAEVRTQAKAKLAELEIYWRQKRTQLLHDPESLEKAEHEYVIERRRVEERAAADVEKIRHQERV